MLFDELELPYISKFQVHYQRSVKRVPKRVNKVGSAGYKAFLHIGYAIPRVNSKEDVSNLFAVLGGEKTLNVACSILHNPTVLLDYHLEHDVSKWKSCSNWCKWWTREAHLREYNVIIFFHRPLSINIIPNRYALIMLLRYG